MQHPHDVRPQLDARSHLGELTSSLDQLNRPTGARAGQRCSQSPYTAASYQYLFFHGYIVNQSAPGKVARAAGQYGP